jgi:DNA-3-methyladenine glycosylase I
MTRNDKEYFEMLILIVFYSGFRSATVENKEGTILKHFPNHNMVFQYTEENIKEILSDPKMIRNERKIRASVNNAKAFKQIVDGFGSFQNYLDSFEARASFENLVLLKEELEYKFSYLGETTVYHLLTDIGFNVLKPDRVILRIFRRLGLIESEKQLLKAVAQGRKFAEHTGQPVRYIDIIFVKYGQQGESKQFGLGNGICLNKNPRCNICGLPDYCDYFKRARNNESNDS